jgi:hypothetical protein
VSSRAAARLAWSIWGAAIIVGFAVPVVVTRVWSPESGIVHAAFGEHLFFAVLLLPLLTVGALIVAKRPGNQMGWVVLAVACAWYLIPSDEGYTDFTAQVAAAPDSGWRVWISYWASGLAVFGTFVFLPLLFPDGHLPSARWRPAGWLAAVALLAWTMHDAFGAETASDIAVPGAVKSERLADILGTIEPLTTLLTAGVVLASAASILIRFRTARGVERQQLKWFAYVASVVAAFFLLAGVTATLSSAQESGMLGAIGWIGGIFGGVVGLPVAIGIAVLRHRLYDIDRLINRTIVFAALSATLLLTYLALVLGLGGAVRDLTGDDSSLVTAASTLVVAALFRPLRGRIQRVVDHRFNRARYDAALTLEAFTARLRDELDLATLSVELQSVVRQTMQPTQVSIWLKPDRSEPNRAMSREGH